MIHPAAILETEENTLLENVDKYYEVIVVNIKYHCMLIISLPAC